MTNTFDPSKQYEATTKAINLGIALVWYRYLFKDEPFENYVFKNLSKKNMNLNVTLTSKQVQLWLDDGLLEEVN